MSEARFCNNCGIVLKGKDWYMRVCHQCVAVSSKSRTTTRQPGYGSPRRSHS